RPAHLEAVDTGQHDVDEHDVRRVTLERLERLLAGLRLLDHPALVLEGHLDGGADALVVLDGEDAGAHPSIIPHRAAVATDTAADVVNPAGRSPVRTRTRRGGR